MKDNVPQPIQNFAARMGFNVLEWAERPDAWVIIAEDGKKIVVDKNNPMCNPVVENSHIEKVRKAKHE